MFGRGVSSRNVNENRHYEAETKGFKIEAETLPPRPRPCTRYMDYIADVNGTYNL